MTEVINQGSRRERKKAEVRARILSTAIEMFSQRGLDPVTVEEIAEAADTGKGTIYNYFSTKEDIVVAFMADLEAKVQERARHLLKARGSLETILSGFIRFQFQQKEPYHRFVRVFLGHMFLHTEHFVPYMLEMQKTIDPPLQEMFSGLQQRGLMRKDLPLPDLILVFKTMHMGLTALWAVEGPPFHGTEHVLKQEIKLFCEGLREQATGNRQQATGRAKP